MQKQHVDTLEQAGGLILDQLVATNAISTDTQAQILNQQAQIEQETGNKPFVGELLEQNGIDTANLKQPLLDLQASARILLHSHGHAEAAQRAEGGYGTIDLQAGVPDNKWTVADMQSGDPSKEQTALLQTRLLQTKTLAATATMLEAAGAEVPDSTLEALRASQDAGREGFGASVKALQAKGVPATPLQESFNALPAASPALSQHEIQVGIAEGIGALKDNGLLSEQQAQTLINQESNRSTEINTLQAKRLARSEEITSGLKEVSEGPASNYRATVTQQRDNPSQGKSR